jgi:hypothetical protein
MVTRTIGNKTEIIPPAPPGAKCCRCGHTAHVSYRPRYLKTENYCFFCFLNADGVAFRIVSRIWSHPDDPNHPPKCENWVANPLEAVHGN